MQKYAGTPEPCPREFQRQYGQHAQCAPMATEALMGARLQRRLREMGMMGARGLDGWAVADLLQLPATLMDMLADLLHLVEEIGVWPALLSRGYISLIPKGEGMGPLQMWPLLGPSLLYRAWEGLRMEESMTWQEAWAHPLSFAFRPKRGALDAALLLALLLELHRLLRRRFGGTGLDALTPPCRGGMAGVVCMARQAHTRGPRDSPLCPYCDTGVPEDQEHILCPAWEPARSMHQADPREAAS